MAAVLACGGGAVLSHRSAAAHWGILQEGPRWVEVTVQRNAGRKLTFVLPHRCTLDDGDAIRRHNIPVTSPSRTLLDCADVVTERQLERALDEAHFLRLDLSGLAPRSGRAGSGRLTRVLGKHTPGATRTRTQLEERMLTWRDAKLVVETDGWQAHGTRSAFEDDRLRDAELIEAGWTVLRVTHDRMVAEPDAVAAQVGRILARRA